MDDTEDVVEAVSACRVDADASAARLESLAADLEETTVREQTSRFGALSSETRYRIVRYLAEAETELCVCELTPLLSVSDSAVSHALSELVTVGLVTRRKEGRWRYYETTETAEAMLAAAGEPATVTPR
ncbi:MAG: ArsR/SmtB family transcription factor [Halanaeroarchaeum sp.]